MKAKLDRDTVTGMLIGAVIVFLCGFIYACLELKQSRANERTLSRQVDKLMKEKNFYEELPKGWRTNGTVMIITNWGFIANTNHLPAEKESVPPPTNLADRIGTIVTNTADTYFHVGVSSAIEAHLLYVKGRLEQGAPVDFRGMPPKEWRQAAKGCWVLSYGKDGFIK